MMAQDSVKQSRRLETALQRERTELGPEQEQRQAQRVVVLFAGSRRQQQTREFTKKR